MLWAAPCTGITGKHLDPYKHPCIFSFPYPTNAKQCIPLSASALGLRGSLRIGVQVLLNHLAFRRGPQGPVESACRAGVLRDA